MSKLRRFQEVREEKQKYNDGEKTGGQRYRESSLSVATK